jgi:peptidoglycan/xylan/chitin deacetylase (PgdA/CDA1 family)
MTVEPTGPLVRLRTLARDFTQSFLEQTPVGASFFWKLSPGEQGVALTFDDGPDPEQTPRILDTLAEFNARATFFVLPAPALRYPELVARMVAEGHALGNHTYTHACCHHLSKAKLRNELERADEVLRPHLPPDALPVFRPPWGAIRPHQAAALLRTGRKIALWNRDSRDYRNAPPSFIAALGHTLRHRDIVLLHDRFPATVEALPLLLERLAARGLPAVPIAGTVPAPIEFRRPRVDRAGIA